MTSMILLIFLFFQIFNLLQNHPHENVAMFNYKPYMEVQFNFFLKNILATSLKPHFKMISFLNIIF
jgi:hypothetical protein